jgi:hypothetical protein
MLKLYKYRVYDYSNAEFIWIKRVGIENAKSLNDNWATLQWGAFSLYPCQPFMQINDPTIAF